MAELNQLEMFTTQERSQFTKLKNEAQRRAVDPYLIIGEARELLLRLAKAIEDLTTERTAPLTEPVKKDIAALFEYWKTQCDYPKAKLNKSMEKTLGARLKSYTLADLKSVVDFGATDPWLNGSDPSATRRFNGLDTLFSSDRKVEKYLGHSGPRTTTWSAGQGDVDGERV